VLLAEKGKKEKIKESDECYACIAVFFLKMSCVFGGPQ
jgi:hypothetical protein